MSLRRSLLIALVAVLAAHDARALDQLPNITVVPSSPLQPGDPDDEPLPPPRDPRPKKPSTPVITAREYEVEGDAVSASVSFTWFNYAEDEGANRVERGSSLVGPWTTVQSFGPLSGFADYTDAGLEPDTRYCYRIVARNRAGESPSKVQCVYTQDGTARSFGRARIRVRTANIAGADTDDLPLVALNWPTQQILPAFNKTWISYSHDELERGVTEEFDLKLSFLGEVGDINHIGILKPGSDDWCLAGFDLLIGGDPTPIYSRSFADLPGGCRWLGDDPGRVNYVDVSFAELRAYPGWDLFDPRPAPIIVRDEIVSRVESTVGHSLHGTALFWGGLENEIGQAEGVEDYVETETVDPFTLHVDLDLRVAVDDAPNVDVDVDFDLEVSGGCNPDGSVSLVVEPTNVAVDPDPGVVTSTLGFLFECGGDGLDCVEERIEETIRSQFPTDPIEAYAEDVPFCDGDPLLFRFDSVGNLYLTQ
jgi:hypothetical protein